MYSLVFLDNNFSFASLHGSNVARGRILIESCKGTFSAENSAVQPDKSAS
jgi:hypothetical protein